MNTLLLVHHQAEFRQSLETYDAMRRYIERHEPRIIQLVRGLDEGPRLLHVGGELYDSIDGTIPADALASLEGQQWITVAGGMREECLERTLQQLRNHNISHRVYERGVYPKKRSGLLLLADYLF